LANPQAFIQQRIRDIDQRRRSTPLPSLTAKDRQPSQFGVDGLDVTHSGLGGLTSDHKEIFASHYIRLPGDGGVKRLFANESALVVGGDPRSGVVSFRWGGLVG
jgi:hypothetical protein